MNTTPKTDTRIVGSSMSAFARPLSMKLSQAGNGRTTAIKTVGLTKNENMRTFDRNFIKSQDMFNSSLEKEIYFTSKRAQEIGEFLKGRRTVLPNTGTFATNINTEDLSKQQERQYEGGTVNLATIGMKESLFGNLQNYEGRKPSKKWDKSKSLITPVTAPAGDLLQFDLLTGDVQPVPFLGGGTRIPGVSVSTQTRGGPGVSVSTQTDFGARSSTPMIDDLVQKVGEYVPKKGDKTTYCDVCEYDYGNHSNYLQHLKSAKHKRNLNKKPSTTRR